MTNEKSYIYLLVNHNHEGSNIRGVFDSLEKAEDAAKKYNEEGIADTLDLFKDDTEEEKKFQIEHFKWWSSVVVEKWEINTVYFPWKVENNE